MKRILTRYYALNFIFVAMVSFFNPILYIFLLKTFTVQQVGTYLSLFWLCSFFTEVPCGAITDVIGEKKSLFISSFFRISGLLLLLSNQYALLLLSALFSSISESFQSGTASSWVINTLKKKGYDESIDYDRMFSRASLIGSSTALIVGFISSNYLYTHAAYLPLVFSMVACFGQVLVVSMIEDYREKVSLDFTQIISTSMNELKSVASGLLKAKIGIILMLLITIPAIIDLGPSNQWQAVFYDANNQSLTSYMWIIISVCGMIGSFIADKVLKQLKPSMTFMILIYINVALVLLMSLNIDMIVRIIIFAIYIIMNTICGVKGSTLLHKEIVEDDRFRNTTVSIYYSFEAIVMAMMLWVNGVSSELIGITNTWTVTAILVAIFVICGYWVILRKNKMN
ncbi:MFS transporter [Aerococcaceae bacterium zg-ZJ1578]|uniref:MFS transporter n=1 Tax=Aerococcaceae bacterium zg-252 TaxID=2796928 RepID=UPI001A223AD7|nr:MFS transporter [Aerococcaceae bacterium zg-1578]